MASSIDPTKPTTGRAYTADVRANFETARSEISALQLADTNLADSTDPALGDALVAVKLEATGSVARTQHDKNEELPTVGDFAVRAA